MKEWEVSQEESGSRLLSFLKTRLPSYSTRRLKQGIERGFCLVNRRVERFASTSLGDGDRVSFCVESLEKLTPPPSVDESRVLYADEALVIYDKPPGIVSEDKGFLKALRRLFPGVEPVHRLDKDTSGALMLARDREMYQALASLFRARKIVKAYLAIVDGNPTKNSGVIEDCLGKLHTYQGQTIWGRKEKGDFAKTAWEQKKKGRHASLLVCYPETGRTHQIRVHMSSMGHPILGDHQYAHQFECAYKPLRCLLHAWEIAFNHPKTKQFLRIRAPLPPDFSAAMDVLFSAENGDEEDTHY
jgi:23S rRNA pseudouridine955/2504/2580 synthase/23S rRNA pseudouridine1911/1915/1917 synthase